MKQYKCPICGYLAGSSSEKMLPQFYCCGERFPVRARTANSIANSSDLTLEEKERDLMGLVKQLRQQKLKSEVKLTTRLHSAERQLKAIMRQRDGIAVLTAKSPHKATMTKNVDRHTQIKMWHMLLSMHAASKGLNPPARPSFDDCVKYAKAQSQPMPEWA